MHREKPKFDFQEAKILKCVCNRFLGKYTDKNLEIYCRRCKRLKNVEDLKNRRN